MADNLHAVYTELFDLVMANDLEVQSKYLSVVEDQRNIPVDYLMSLGAMFIPNNDYIIYYLGDRALNPKLGFYRNGRCLWSLFVVIPIRDLSGEVVGLCGWDAYNKYLEVAEGAEGLSKYSVSSSAIFARDKYFLSDVNCLQRAFKHRVIFVTDGVFDALSLSYRGLPAIALLGSSFSREVLYFLSWYKHIYVCADNDKAGLSLHKRLAKSLPSVHSIIQNKTKDIEELLRGDGLDGNITTQLKNLLCNPIPSDLYLKL